jgi:hypothetical protein
LPHHIDLAQAIAQTGQPLRRGIAAALLQRRLGQLTNSTEKTLLKCWRRFISCPMNSRMTVLQ